MTVVTFQDYTPPPRTDVPWVSAEVQESATSTGTWTVIATIALSPVDAAPLLPAARTFTTTAATQSSGWYQIVWVDATGGRSIPTQPVHNTPAGTPSWAPTTQDVADLGPQYVSTRAEDGPQGGARPDFTTTTVPTKAAVERLIEDAVDEVIGRVGAQIPARLENLANRTAKYHAAAAVAAMRSPQRADDTVGDVAWKQNTYIANLKELTAQARGSLILHIA